MSGLRTSRKNRVHLVLFSTEGPPFDNGKNIREAAEQMATLASPHFDSVRLFTPRLLIRQDPDWNETFADVSAHIISNPLFSDKMPWSEDWSRIGYFLWKPRLLSELAKQHGEDDIILYHDPDWTRYPEYIENIDRWAAFAQKSLRRTQLMLSRDKKTPLAYDVKPELLEKFGLGPRARQLLSVWAGFIVFRCSDFSRSFLDEWYELSKDSENLLPITRAHRGLRYRLHSADQAVLSVRYHLAREERSAKYIKVIYLRESRRFPPRNLILFRLDQLRNLPYTLGLIFRRARRRGLSLFSRLFVKLWPTGK